MARIRTIKPEFFRHEGLQDLEAENPGAYPMLVFAGLWGHCDKSGRFEWRPRMLKLDILPFLNFDMTATLQLLVASGYLRRYSADGGHYGLIPSFGEHQRINGKESQEPERYPEPPEIFEEATETQQGSTREATETTGREGKGKEGNGYAGLTPAVPPPQKSLNGKNREQQDSAREVIEFLNAKAGRNFDAKGPNLEFVVARLKEGESVEDLRAVVAKKCREWSGDEKMTAYLRPETLFNRTKFASYKGELGANQ